MVARAGKGAEWRGQERERMEGLLYKSLQIARRRLEVGESNDTGYERGIPHGSTSGRVNLLQGDQENRSIAISSQRGGSL